MHETMDMFSGSGGLVTTATVPLQSSRPLKVTSPRVLPFGKLKGQPYEVLLQEPGYALWLMSSMFSKLQTDHPELLAFLVSRYGIPDRTPVHNRLQNLFLDEPFCYQFALAASAPVRQAAEHLSKGPISVDALWRAHVVSSLRSCAFLTTMEERDVALQEAEKNLETRRTALLHQAEHLQLSGISAYAPRAGLLPVARLCQLDFEVNGADVRFSVSQGFSVTTELHISERQYGQSDTATLDRFAQQETFRIEVKPVLGDDYPAVLRTMKATDCTHLLVDEYCGAGATWEQIVKVFGLSKIKAVLLSEVEQTQVPSSFGGVPVTLLTADAARAIVVAAYDEQLNLLRQR